MAEETNQRDQGLVDRLNSAYNTGRSAVRMAQWGSKTVPLLANPVTWIVLGAIFLLIVFIIVLSGGGGGELPGPGDGKDKIPGLTLNKSGPERVDNGENIAYAISGSYPGNQDILISDPLPQNTTFVNASGNYSNKEVKTITWRLKDNLGASQNFSFTLTVHPEKPDITVYNKVSAQVIGGGIVGGGGSGNECTRPYEGSEYCSLENLKQPFGDGTKALIASLVCQAESGSDPFVINDNCRTNDYSVGLFQINLVAHCDGAYADQSCTRPINLQKRSTCEQTWLKANENITKATEVSEAGTKWNKWGTWSASNQGNPAVKDTLKKCNIQY